MAGISSKAAASSINKKGYNGNELQNKEFSDGSGLEVYDFNARTYDQQIGRFIQIDPLFEGGQESINPYHFSYNNPIRFSDPDGIFPIWPAIPFIVEGIKIAAALAVSYYTAKAVSPIIERGINDLGKTNVPSAQMPLGSPLMMGTASYTKSDKKVPNHNGKKGGEAHQKTIDKEEQRLKDQGYDKTEREVPVATPGGTKEKRYIDLKGTNTKTGATEEVQVGKQNKNGTPVSREQKALNDIEKATGVRPTYVPYNPPSPSVSPLYPFKKSS